ncbi:hypothetical protein B0F90DRAFT_395233 [Multifurca ochricompacta]|uniref:Uncharacterized protein n=1 Tax=Multifurca ochricompacta TaxID=376703 RepID=A0AAD4M5R0_9AGAM|nr:hypothetical protein B0F90DRAFT_395233 [Multifurca ochricompacta]
MRIFRVLPILGLLFGAHASPLESREPASHPLDARAPLDVCANVNVDLAVPDSLGTLTTVGRIDVCLCLSALPLFLKTNNVAIVAVQTASESVVTDILTKIIIGTAPNAHCVYPDHSTPICINGNPCGFQCTDGFTPYPPQYPTTCVCDAPNIVCNGKCVPPGSCLPFL